MNENVYLISFSKLQDMFILLTSNNKRVVTVSKEFTEMQKRINQLQEDNNIKLIFTDAAIDELARRSMCDEGVM